MGEIGDSIEAALQATQTRPIPVSPQARIKALVKAEKGSTKATAARLGCSQRQVERYLAGQVKRPTPRLAGALERELRRVWQPRLRARAIKKAAAAGIVVETRARFGFTAAGGSTDDPRMRRITEQLPPNIAAQLLAAHQAGADEQQLAQILADGLGYAYFRDRGRRADGLEVELSDVDYCDLDLL
ncbi:telomere-protecting terminal protein Tpg [Streptomyces sp. WMMC1477]|uniref:telomere-protecting terminal protein Tpg n=1 Tax=Streptomyces sp. WMMC1477 TaxID=3015155 RepID=UPI0022B68DD1|nr:XRE family transcriptional regulator [Streptomyces sp. WMMC1477]MCZ7430136.1 XRE family transcriptional regulator [Streptomyces sp. WMMC1477]